MSNSVYDKETKGRFPAGPAGLPFGADRSEGTGGHGRPGGPMGPVEMAVPGVDFPITTAVPQYPDLAYANVSPAQKLDLYLPKGKGLFPLVLIVHGGAFMFGDKAEPLSKAGTDQLLEHGYAVAVVNYRLSGEARAPAQIQDLKASVRWLRANVKKYNLNPDKFGAWGASAGANLVALLGTAIKVPELEGAELGNPNQSSRIQAVVDWFGPTDFLLMDPQLVELGFSPSHDDPDSPESRLIGAPIRACPELVKKINPISYITSKAAPFLIEHGTKDKVVPYLQSKILADALASKVAPDCIQFVPLKDAEHGGGIQFWEPGNLKKVLGFLDRYLK